MYSISNTALNTERNLAGGIAPQDGIEITSAAALTTGSNAVTFYTNGETISHWYMTFGTTAGAADDSTSAVFTGATLDGTAGAGVPITTNAFTGSYTWVDGGADTYYLTLYYKYGASSEYKSITQVIIVTA
jgi:hypothetical protein